MPKNIFFMIQPLIFPLIMIPKALTKALPFIFLQNIRQKFTNFRLKLLFGWSITKIWYRSSKQHMNKTECFSSKLTFWNYFRWYRATGYVLDCRHEINASPSVPWGHLQTAKWRFASHVAPAPHWPRQGLTHW